LNKYESPNILRNLSKILSKQSNEDKSNLEQKLSPDQNLKKFQNLKFQYTKLNNKKTIFQIKYSLKNSAATKDFKMS